MNRASVERSRLAGLVGAGIGPSRTPFMHEAEGAASGFPYVYRRIDLEALGLGLADLPAILAWAERLGFDGLNVTHPCKQAIVAHLDELAPAAEAIGAVNTVVFANGRRIGHNTDGTGFLEAFRRGLPDVARDRVVLIGAGGGGAAVAWALLQARVRQLRLFDRDAERARALAARMAARFPDRGLLCVGDLASALADADGLVNATPVGMAAYPGSPVPFELLRPELWVADIVYFPLETELLRAARARGCRTLDGSGMAVFQAVEAFRLFTGREPDVARMFRHFEAAALATDPNRGGSR
ncbi:MAG: shikimate dehydrogenase [Geminicoccaceae bacterium]|nr:shikimate dehydrogenase [Geminicoccaceae bacterium]MCS7268919.1 shikimate dehydrogenase [Geminicoccaceae bacterium]MCX7630441.1 shikimate dehydrogenase [Geminicoccaceae bacterium]MDW8125414.1 shikimate dehydrogenase [Geminicoccaceae bacterium]MDW8341055.1 shikimate dehydrogenase [Geminicoccaceae bacterium]